MDFDLPEELVAFRQSARDFALREMAPLVDEAERDERTPRRLFEQAGRAGFLGIRYPTDIGGAGASCLAETILREELGYVCSGLASALSVTSHLGTYPIHAFGSREQQERYLVPALQGAKISAFALTEPDAGSDVRSIRTRAERSGDGWTLTGRKTFITNAPLADFMIVVAYIDPDAGIEGMGMFVIDLPAAGVSVNRLAKMGNLSSEIGEVVLDSVEVPADALIGEAGGTFKQVMRTLNVGRVVVSGGAIGLARAALDAAVAYAGDRVAFGNAIGSYQGVAFPLARAAAMLETARLAVYKAAWLFDEGRDPVTETSVAKLVAAETALYVTDKAIRTFGGYGYIRESPVERYYRDARYFAIVEGTQEIHQRVIAQRLGLPV